MLSCRSNLFLYLCAPNLCVSVLNDAIHVSKDSGLTMGMAVCSVGVWQAALKLSGLRFGLELSNTHSSCTLLPTAGHLIYCNTWPRVSGNFVARKLPAASAPAANKMGTALVMPTNDWKMLMPRTAASLQRAFRKPNAVVLHKRRDGENTITTF